MDSQNQSYDYDDIIIGKPVKHCIIKDHKIILENYVNNPLLLSTQDIFNIGKFVEKQLKELQKNYVVDPLIEEIISKSPIESTKYSENLFEVFGRDYKLSFIIEKSILTSSEYAPLYIAFIRKNKIKLNQQTYDILTKYLSEQKGVNNKERVENGWKNSFFITSFDNETNKNFDMKLNEILGIDNEK